MQYLVISDIHANLEAFQAVLDTAGPWGAILFLGDLVGYGPSPNECADLLRSLDGVTSVVGNHDVAALGEIDLADFNDNARIAAEWTQREMTGATRDYLRSLAQIEQIDGITTVHGSPRDPVWEYLDQPEQAPENFARLTTPVCFVGHTHVPRIFSQDPDTKEAAVHVPDAEAGFRTGDGIRRIVNPGSVGQPRDGDRRASFGVYDSDANTFEYHRTSYDVEATQARMKAAGLPKPLADRLSFGF
jgi:predicted phosphodiesterase